MKPLLTGSLILAIAFVQAVSGQETPAAALTASAAIQAATQAGAPASAMAEDSGKYKLAEGTDVDLQFAQDLGSSTSFEGDPVTLTLVGDLKVGGVVVAKAGSKAYGVVTTAQRAGMMGKPGQLDIRLDYLQTADGKIKLRGTRNKEGEGRIKGALLAPIGRIKHGKNVEIKAGDPLRAYVADDVLLPPVRSE